jgi:hypothetical protein
MAASACRPRGEYTRGVHTLWYFNCMHQRPSAARRGGARAALASAHFPCVLKEGVRAAAVDALGAVRARCRHGAACLEVPHAAAHAAAGGRAPLLTATCRHRSTVAYSPRAACCAWPPSTLSSRKTHLKRARAWWGWVWWQGSRGGRADRVVLLDCVGGGEPPPEQLQAPSAHAHCSAVRDQPGARSSGRLRRPVPVRLRAYARRDVT